MKEYTGNWRFVIDNGYWILQVEAKQYATSEDDPPTHCIFEDATPGQLEIGNKSTLSIFNIIAKSANLKLDVHDISGRFWGRPKKVVLQNSERS